MNVILYTFWGRRCNIELQWPFIRRILDEHPNVQFDVWDLSRTAEDHDYVSTIEGERTTVRTDFYSACPWTGFNDVYHWYAQRGECRNHLFVKVDDDVVFIETHRFEQFIRTIEANRATRCGGIVSALTVNNGASTPWIPGIQAGFNHLGVPLLDVHESNAYADMCHTWFRDNWTTLLDSADSPVQTEDWLSINCIGHDWYTMNVISDMVGTVTPRTIAGRDCSQWPQMGDEGVCNTLPRIIDRGMVVAHLTFGPQNVTDEQAALWRKAYAEVAREYLA